MKSSLGLKPKELFSLKLFLIFLCSISTARGSWAYTTMSELLRDAHLVIVAKVVSITEIEESRYALAKPIEILKGEWRIDSIIRLPVHEKNLPDENGYINYNFIKVVYDSGSTYLLLIRSRKDYFDVNYYPHKTKIQITKNNKEIIDDVKKMLRIDTISSPSKKAICYTELLKSAYTEIRESAALELGRVECQEALNGLMFALRDTSHHVYGYAAAGMYLLGKKGISSDSAVVLLKAFLTKSLKTALMLRALAAQGGEKVIPYLRDYYSSCDEGREGVLEAFMLLQDTAST